MLTDDAAPRLSENTAILYGAFLVAALARLVEEAEGLEPYQAGQAAAHYLRVAARDEGMTIEAGDKLMRRAEEQAQRLYRARFERVRGREDAAGR
jgi:hypothetical protein